jgi:uncharacterized protein YdhG (YjbR/CyaY superfamily)
MNKPNNVEEYFAELDRVSHGALSELRSIIKQAAPDAEETLSYGMPCFKQNGILVYYAAFKGHYSLFPTGSGIKHFKDRLTNFKTSKGTIQFKFGDPLPVELITDIVRFRLEENSFKKSKAKNK